MNAYVIPVLCACSSSIARGLTQYGDAIIFHVCSSSLRVVTGSPESDGNLQFSVLCTAIMSITSLPLSLYLARKHILSNLPFGLALSSTGIAFLPLGTLALFLGNTSALEAAVGVFFMLFSMIRITNAVLDKALKNKVDSAESASASNSSGTGPDKLASIETDSASNSVTGPDKLASTDVSVSRPDTNTDTDIQIVRPLSFGISYWINEKVVAISSKHSSSVTMLVFAVAGAFAGFLNALMGTGGPPQMAAFSILEISKDDVRGIATIFAVFELPIRIALWIQTAGSAWNPEREGTVYLSVAGASVFGFIVGAHFRAKVDTVAVSNCMLIIIFLGAIVLLGGAKSMVIAVYCSIVTALFMSFLLLVWMQPEKINNTLRRVWTCVIPSEQPK